MTPPLRPVLFALALAPALAVAPASVQPAPSPEFTRLEAQQNAANARPGPRTVPGREIPVPGDISPELQKVVAAPYRIPAWDLDPQTADEWKQQVAKLATATAATVATLRDRLGVTSQDAVIGGVRAWIIQPKELPPGNRNRLLVHAHGGGYVYNPGEAGTQEAVLMAAYGKFKVGSFDYRMSPDHPYPAAMDDAMAVYKAALTMAKPENMAIFGTSTGGAMTLAMVLRAKAEGLPLPAAIAPGTPWSDLTATGDSYQTHEWGDNRLGR